MKKIKINFYGVICCSTFSIRAKSGFAKCFIWIKGWEKLLREKDKWQEATVPGTVHQDLLRLKLPDPFFGTNEQQVQWVEDKDWGVSHLLQPLRRNGLTIAVPYSNLKGWIPMQMYLNGALILKAENMFVGYEVPVKEVLPCWRKQIEYLLLFAHKQDAPSMGQQQVRYPADNDHTTSTPVCLPERLRTITVGTGDPDGRLWSMASNRIEVVRSGRHQGLLPVGFQSAATRSKSPMSWRCTPSKIQTRRPRLSLPVR